MTVRDERTGGAGLLAHDLPLYERTTAAILELIETGGYQAGQRLPAESELSSELGVSRSTLREALNELRNRGVVDRRHGIGTFVVDPDPHPIHGGLEQLASLKVLSERSGTEVERADWRVEAAADCEFERQVLGLDPGTDMVRVRSAASMDGSRCATIDSFIAASFVDVDQLRDFEDGTLLDFILTRHTPAVAYTRTDIAAMSVTGEEALWLQVPSGTPVLHLTETYFDSARVPVLYSRNNFLTGPVAFHIERRPSR